MSKIRRVDFSPDEWIAGTRDLTLEERGAYWDLCSLIYSRGGPVADDERWIGKALGCDVRTWRRVRGRLLEVGKLRSIEIEGQACLTNGRAEREIERATGRISQAREAADESVRARRQNQDRPNFGEKSAGSSAEVPPKSRRSSGENQGDLLNINALDRAVASGDDRANHQPSTTNTVTTTETGERARAKRRAAPTPVERADRKTKLPEDWTLTDKLRDWTTGTLAGCGAADRVDIERELAKFRAHHIGKQTRWVRWDQAWNTWIFNAIEWSERNGSSIGRQGRQRKDTEPAGSRAAHGYAYYAAAGAGQLAKRRPPGDEDPA